MVTADNNSSSSTVQHVTKKSSDELLRKFAEMSDANGAKKLELARVIRRRKTRRDLGSDDLSDGPSYYKSSSSLVERRSLLPPTWRKTVEGASKVFLEKHYNRHRRLINDMI
ncbi:hypothetical protein SADUNF_Sadunf06G0149900 [Salix dunnii]|uniref:Uncharacterized protein n=1 Tax=Salix dunnii TaxID=1413687 RepID=A0A835K4T6_9ROSI|nr:hypothetical protein SADUNF_Sadunf06G0149900 [Salix dunnii]